MLHVFGYHHQVVFQGCGSDENVGVTNELALLVSNAYRSAACTMMSSVNGNTKLC